MVNSSKFASLVASVTLAFVLASSIHPVNTAPVAVRRQDASQTSAPAGYISVAQPQMSEQDIYAVGIPDAPTQTNPEGAANSLEQVLQAAAQAALKTSNQTMSVVNHYDATPAAAGAAPAQVASTNAQVAQPANSTDDAAMSRNPDEGNLYKQVIGTTSEATETAGGADSILQGNPDEGDAYKQIIDQQMAQFGARAQRAFEERWKNAVLGARQLEQLETELQQGEQEDLGVGVPTPSSATMVASADVPEVTPTLSSATAAMDGNGATAAEASGLAGVPVAPPVPSDYSSPPEPSPSSNLAVSGAPAVSVPVGSAVPTSALPTSVLPTSAVSTGVPSDAPSAAVPSVSVPASGVPAAPSTPVVVSSVSAPAVLPSLNAAAASATTVLPTSDADLDHVKTKAAAATGDLTMTVTVPSKSLPTSIAGLPNVKANNNNVDDGNDEWKTMTILVPAEAFCGIAGVQTQINLPDSTNVASSSLAAVTSSVVASSSVAASSSSVAASSSSSASDSGTKNKAVSSTASASVKATPTTTAAPINLSSFSAMKPEATNVLTIPLTGVVDGTTYSTMLTLTIPKLGGTSTAPAPAMTTSVSVSATEKAQSATASVSASSSTTKTKTSTSLSPTTSVDPSYISPDDMPPLLKSSITVSPTSTPTSTSTGSGKDPTTTDDGDDEDCEEEGDGNGVGSSVSGKSLLTKVWDWVTGKPLNERDFEEDYDYDYED